MPMRRLTFAMSVTLAAGCAPAINEKVAGNHAQAGQVALARGDWDGARRAFARAATNAELANSDVRRRAVFHYEYGRALGATCYFAEAERELTLAHDLDRQGGQPLYLSLFELARLSLDQGRFQPAVRYFERAFAEADRADAARQAPMAYADILDEFAAALSGSGRAREAEAATARAIAIRGANPKGRSSTDRTPYGKHCGRS